MFKAAADLLIDHGPQLGEAFVKGGPKALMEVGTQVATQKVLPQMLPQVVPLVNESFFRQKSKNLPAIVSQQVGQLCVEVQNRSNNKPSSGGNGSALAGLAGGAVNFAVACVAKANPLVGAVALFSRGVSAAIEVGFGIKGLKAGQARIEQGIGTLIGGQSQIIEGIGSLLTGQGRIKEGVARVEAGVDRLEIGQAQIQASIQEGFASVTNFVQYNGKLLNTVIDQQKYNQEELKGEHALTRREMHARFDRADDKLDKVQKTIEASDIRNLNAKMNTLLGEYNGFTALLRKGQPLVERDLHKIEESAKDLLGLFETYYKERPAGSPDRLPFLMGMCFCLGAWYDAREALGDPLNQCFQRARAIADFVSAELKVIKEKSTLYDLAVEKASLVAQYVALLQSCRALSSVERRKGEEVVLLVLPGWDDGLLPVRDLFLKAQKIGSNSSTPDLSKAVLELKNTEQRNAWRTLAKLPSSVSVDKVSVEDFKSAFGLPKELSLEASIASDLIAVAPAVLAHNERVMKKQLSGWL